MSAPAVCPAHSSRGGPAGPPSGVPGVAETCVRGPGWFQARRARPSRARSETSPPRAGHTEKSRRVAVSHASG
ncbi:hypothetical protein, partial [Streptomyces sp. SPB78]|uniref:hypothetical protein n=1 Tax=Streptomyces sp. (strain SPB78) TaxID=591157 RepID=UPI001F3E5F25